MLVRPFPGMAEKLFAREAVFRNPFGFQFGDNLCLRRNRRMVGARHPASIPAQHPRPAHQYILDRIVEHVPHVQHTGHIGRGNHNRIRLTPSGTELNNPLSIQYLYHLSSTAAGLYLLSISIIQLFICDLRTQKY